MLMISPSDIPSGPMVRVSRSTGACFSFAVLVSVLTGILFGLMPALSASRTDVATLIKDTGSQTGAGVRGKRSQSALVIPEVALAELAKSFMQKNGYKFPVLIAKNFAEDLMPYFFIPRTWIVRDGSVAEEAEGPGLSWDQWVDRIVAQVK